MGPVPSFGFQLTKLLRVRRARPRHRAAEQRDEVAAIHSITSSVRASSLSSTVRGSLKEAAQA
jgi:hypothetical protein